MRPIVVVEGEVLEVGGEPALVTVQPADGGPVVLQVHVVEARALAAHLYRRVRIEIHADAAATAEEG